MYKSVKDNGGFYIGRYEAGAEGGKLEIGEEEHGKWLIMPKTVCKKGATVYNYIGWSNQDDMTIETGGAVEVARKFAIQQGYTSVKSTLCYGVQWDAVMKWMKNVENYNILGKKYIVDSTKMGWYSDNSNNEPKNTGTDIDGGKNKIKNIYDMAGNVIEWTMEAYSSRNRLRRGGSFNATADVRPASSRFCDHPSEALIGVGFRPTLYLI